MALIHEISVTNNLFELTVPTRQAVQKRLEYIRYGRIIPSADIPLEYIAFNPLIARETLAISDLSANFRNNNRRVTRSFDDAEVFTGKNFNSETSKILITNQYQVLDDGSVVPYFYSHSLPDDTVSVSVQAVTPAGTSEVDTTQYIVNEDKTLIFASFLNWFDEISGRYTFYYVESVDSLGNYTVALYNPVDAFHEATFDDIDEVTGLLKTDTNAYVLNTLGSRFLFTLPKVDTYYIQEQNNTRIRVLEPALQSADDPWIIRVTTGDFNQIIDGISYNYFIEEYDLQVFVPSQPTKFAANENVIYVNDSIIKLQRETARISPDDLLHLDLLVYSKLDGELLFALTTDSDKDETAYSDTSIEYDSNKIADWDNKLGIVRVDDLEIKEDYLVKAFYYYDEEAYEYTVIDLNPIFNPDIEGTMVVIYVVPNTKGTDENSIYHLIVKDNIILSTTQTGGTVVPNLSAFNSDGTPNPNSIVGSEYKTDGTSGSGAFEALYPQYLVLAEINVLEPSRIPDAVRVDIRSPGGTVADEHVESAIRANSHVAYTPGIAPLGGYPYPKYATHVIRVPYTLLTTYGGELTMNIIRSKVEKHMAAGEYPVIMLDGVIPEIYEIVPGTCITLRWYLDDPTYQYKIYRSLNIDSGFALLATVNGSSYNDNEYIDCDVSAGTGYYYYIRALSPDNIEGPGSVVWGARAL
jgi:hypothetical protein